MNGKALTFGIVFVLTISGLSVLYGTVSADFGIEGADSPIEVHGSLSFLFYPESGLMKNISFENQTIIDEISLPGGGFTFPDIGEKSGYIKTGSYDIIYDSYPEPVITIKSVYGMKCVLSIPKNHISPGERVQKFDVNGITLSVVTDGFVNEKGEIMLEAQDVLVMKFSPDSDASNESGASDAIKNAISLSNVGAEVSISGSNCTSMEYDGVHVKALELSERNMSFMVSSNESRGRCLVFRVNHTMEHVRVLLDGVKVGEGSYYDALFSMGNRSIWNATTDSGGTTIYVYVPHFSEHIITIEEENSGALASTPTPENSGSNGSVFLPAILAVVVSAGALFGLVRKRKAT